MGIVGLANEFQRWPEHIRVISTDTSNKAVRITSMDHLSGEVRPALEQASCIGPGRSFALTAFEKGVGVLRFSSLVVARVIGFVFEVQAQFLHHPVDAVHRAEKDGVADVLLDQLSGCSQHGFLVAFREDDALAFALDLVDHLTHYGVGFAQTSLEFLLVSVDVELISRNAGNTLVDGGLRYCGGLPKKHPSVEGFGDDVFGSVLHDHPIVGGRDVIGYRLLCKGCERFGGGHFHVLRDVSGTNVQSATENVGETEHVVHLIGVVGASRGDDGVLAHLKHLFGEDFRGRVGQGEDDGFVRHARDHVLGDQTTARKTQHDVSTLQSVRQVTGGTVLRKGRLVLVQFTRIQASLGDDALAVDQGDVVHAHTHSDVVVRTGDGRCPGADDDHGEVGEVLALEFGGVEQGRCGDDGRAVLVVVHDGNVGRFRNAAFDFKTLGGFDVLEVDATEGLRNVDDGVDEFLRVFGVHFDVKHINTGEGLEQQPLAFHDGFAGQSTDVAQAEHGSAVGNHGDEVAFGGVAVSVFRSLLNFQTGIGHAGGIGQTQLVSGGMGFGRYDLDFSLWFSLVILKRFLAQHPVFFAHGHGLPRKKGKKAGFDCCAKLKPS